MSRGSPKMTVKFYSDLIRRASRIFFIAFCQSCYGQSCYSDTRVSGSPSNQTRSGSLRHIELRRIAASFAVFFLLLFFPSVSFVPSFFVKNEITGLKCVRKVPSLTLCPTRVIYVASRLTSVCPSCWSHNTIDSVNKMTEIAGSVTVCSPTPSTTPPSPLPSRCWPNSVCNWTFCWQHAHGENICSLGT